MHLVPASGAPTTSTSVGYVVDGIFHSGATTIPLPPDLRTSYAVARLGEGLLVSGPEGWVIVGPDGRKGPVISTAWQTPRVSDDGTHVLADDADGNLLYVDSAGRTVARLRAASGAGAGYSPAGLIGTTAYASRPGTGSSVAWDVESGAVRTLEGELSFVNASAGTGASIGGSDVKGDGSKMCHGLVDLASGHELWRLCGPLNMFGFSDDGRYVLATGHVDGLRIWLFESLVVIRASDGAIVLQGGGLEADAKDDIVGARMGADRQLTVQVWNGDRRSLQRCGLDGSCQVVGEALPVTDAEAPLPYVLSAN